MAQLTVAKRENNPKRDFLIINKQLAKHYPCSAIEAEGEYEHLGAFIRRRCPSAECAIIAFAEASVSVGAYIAGMLGWRCSFLSTTRSELNMEGYTCVNFEEEHSHAVNHALYIPDGFFDNIQHLFVIDDEFTTGRTAVNLIEALQGIIPDGIKITLAAFAVGSESEKLFKEHKLEYIALYDFKGLFDKALPTEFIADEPVVVRKPDKEFTVRAKCNPRLGTNGAKCKEECYVLGAEIARQLPFDDMRGKHIEVIGTEECCLPALILGEVLERRRAVVNVHAMTRSPMLPSKADGYPIHSRSKLTSLYNSSCAAYLYNCAPCDLAVIVSDAKEVSDTAMCELCGAVKVNSVVFVHWDN